jgi:hypothetical protein
MGFDGLDFAQQLNLRRGGGLPGSLFTNIDEGERIPLAVRNQFCAQRGVKPGFQQRRGLTGDIRECTVATHPVKPVSGVSKIGFAPVDNAVEEAAIGVLDALGKGMGGVQTVVPEEDQSADQILGGGREIGMGQEAAQAMIQLLVRQDPLARPRPQFRQTTDCQQVPEFFDVGAACHGSNLRSAGAVFKSFCANESASRLSIKAFAHAAGLRTGPEYWAAALCG